MPGLSTRPGRIPHVALGRYRRYEREAVLAWVEQQRQGGNAAAEPRGRPKAGG